MVQAARPYLRGRRYRLYLFGSRARGTATPRSDYDLALWADPPLDLPTLGALRAALEELPLPVRVDLVDLRLSPGLLRAVEEEGVLLDEA